MEEYYMMWLSRIERIGIQRATLLLDHFGTATEIWEASLQELLEVEGLSPSQCKRIQQAKDGEQLENWIAELEEKNIQFFSMKHPLYPVLLKEIYDPPMGIYIKGMLPDDNIDKVGIVGARKCSPYGSLVTHRLAQDLGKTNIVVVSGMALGIDGMAHQGVLDGGGQTIAVLGCGVDICYPLEHMGLMERIIKSGCVLSEYPPGTPPYAKNFPRRNRIISGLSKMLIVIEAGKKSGTLITADQALENGRDVFVVPGNVTSAFSEGTNNLIKQGCPIITNVEDVLFELGIAYTTKEKEIFQKHMADNIEPEHKTVFDCIGAEPIDAEEISRRIKKEVQDIQYSLTILEIAGYIQKLPQLGYIREG